ncbi:Histidinol-phosphate aminotransferase 2 [Aminobacter sp. MSH1]|nr:histidinol-phosphate transaminase [Aminobacter sp. MSH1]AWC20926.1 Histidinol-phosphate aminotransferase 2 [Aminobacter sp. MSH1]
MQSVQQNALSPRQEVVALPIYNAGISVAVAQRVSGREDIAALASNENPYGASPVVAAALGALMPSRYSDPASGALRQALSEKLGSAPNRIVCGNGSEELIAALCRTYLQKGDTVLTISPCFGLHEIEPMAAGAQVIKVPMTKAFDYDADALVHELVRKPKIVFISSPSNPVGTAMSQPELDRLLDAVQPETLFVLDEAYFELVDSGYPDGLKVLTPRPNLNWVVLRTFSKAYGLAGLRVGYGISSDEGIARAMRAALTPFNVNAAAQAAAVAALLDDDWMHQAAAKIRRDRTILADHLREMGVRVVPSQTNFLFLELNAEAAPVARALLQKGIIVKPWMEAGYTNFLRVSIGTAGDNERFAQELGRALGPCLAETRGNVDQKAGFRKALRG